MQSPPHPEAGSLLQQSTSPNVHRKRRKRAVGYYRVAAVVIMLIGAIIVVRKTVAVAQIAVQAPLPLAYAYVPSPNCDDRPPAGPVNCIVLHSTVEATTEGTMGIFLDPAKKVSAHFVVGKDGRVVQMVPVERRAWHAGTSVLDGVGRVNDYSVGIEMVNLNDGRDPYPQPQLDAVAGLIRFIRSKYPIPDDRIVSHAQIALPAGRKSDPAAFDFEKIRMLARVGTTEDPSKGANNLNRNGNPLPDTVAKPLNNP